MAMTDATARPPLDVGEAWHRHRHEQHGYGAQANEGCYPLTCLGDILARLQAESPAQEQCPDCGEPMEPGEWDAGRECENPECPGLQAGSPAQGDERLTEEVVRTLRRPLHTGPTYGHPPTSPEAESPAQEQYVATERLRYWFERALNRYKGFDDREVRAAALEAFDRAALEAGDNR